jgi:hypothetical protein
MGNNLHAIPPDPVFDDLVVSMHLHKRLPLSFIRLEKQQSGPASKRSPTRRGSPDAFQQG